MSNPIKLRTTSGWINQSVSCNAPTWGFKAEIIDKVTGEVVGTGSSRKSKKSAQIRACEAANVAPDSFGLVS